MQEISIVETWRPPYISKNFFKAVSLYLIDNEKKNKKQKTSAQAHLDAKER